MRAHDPKVCLMLGGTAFLFKLPRSGRELEN
jgi:hypothetical protein